MTIFFFHRHQKAHRVFSFDCDLYLEDGAPLFIAKKEAGSACLFYPDGSYIGLNLVKINRNDEIEWKIPSIQPHHSIQKSNDKKSFLVVVAESMNFENKVIKTDCVHRFDLAGREISKWCLKDHLSELQNMGYKFQIQKLSPTQAKLNKQIEGEISHANSAYEIPTNKLGSRDRRFAEGNVLFNLYKSTGLLLILDHNLKEILWAESSKQNGLLLHDVKIDSEGRMLAFSAVYRTVSPDFFSELFKIRVTRRQPFNDLCDSGQKVTPSFLRWNPAETRRRYESIYANDELAHELFGAHRGSISQLESNRFLIMYTTDSGEFIRIIDEKGEPISKIYEPERGFVSQKKVFSTFPLDEPEFLRIRGIY